MGWLMDSNVFIQAANDYYNFGFCPGFWDWLLQHTSEIRSVEKVQEEIMAKEDGLATWCKENLPKSFFHKPNEKIFDNLKQITQYLKSLGSPYDLSKKRKFLDGADPLLIATAMHTGDVIITHEKDDPQSKKKIYLPKVADNFKVPHTRLFDVMLELNARLVLENMD
ncbi:MAG: DUF4411 family protein [Victivallales bacterium]|nr:DUF4411 family protein [Victivallales bacterium]